MDYSKIFSSLVGAGVVALVVGVILIIGISVFYLVCLWKFYKKAGKNGWEAIIPFYNGWVLVEIAGLNWWYFLPGVISALGIGNAFFSVIIQLACLAASFFTFYNIGKKMGKDPILHGILGALFPVIMIPIYALNKDFVFDKNVDVSPNGPIEAKAK